MAKLNSIHPRGLASYIKTTRELLADSKPGKNSYDGFTPSVPTGEIISFGDDNFIKFEEAGIKEAQNAAFVLVAESIADSLQASYTTNVTSISISSYSPKPSSTSSPKPTCSSFSPKASMWATITLT
ncbi:UDP-sugar pyrophosphorylase-like isoform X2 [Durio zibethinus]|uniref:UDP-sugar pyrophosphorylase-like isoform X2 n=1 Tax=Durio zibethinus TaxID=66656 RepID=A0A6P5WNS4_DURZI|nr:UDP-sugar pyrophosphorylase-like isoform X2 [Durio zibethinus]